MIDPKEIRKKLKRIAELHATPIEFDDLERRGIISKAPKEGKRWYKVNGELPEHAAHQVREIKSDSRTKEAWVKFDRPEKNASWAKRAKQL